VWDVSSTEFKIMDYGTVKSLEIKSTEAIRKAMHEASRKELKRGTNELSQASNRVVERP
jgi:hypothetical protein